MEIQKISLLSHARDETKKCPFLYFVVEYNISSFLSSITILLCCRTLFLLIGRQKILYLPFQGKMVHIRPLAFAQQVMVTCREVLRLLFGTPQLQHDIPEIQVEYSVLWFPIKICRNPIRWNASNCFLVPTVRQELK